MRSIEKAKFNTICALRKARVLNEGCVQKLKKKVEFYRKRASQARLTLINERRKSRAMRAKYMCHGRTEETTEEQTECISRISEYGERGKGMVYDCFTRSS